MFYFPLFLATLCKKCLNCLKSTLNMIHSYCLFFFYIFCIWTMLPCVLFDHINFVMVGRWGGWLVYWSWWVQMLKKSGVKYPCECEHLLHSPSCVRRTIQHWVRLWFFFFYSLRAIVLVATFCFFSNCMKKLSYFLFMFIIRSIEIANTGGNKKPKLYTHKKKILY